MDSKLLTYIEQELAKKFGSKFKILTSNPVGGGCISRSLRLRTSRGEFFMKWNPSVQYDLFVKEAEGLKALKQTVGDALVIPGVILAAESGEWPGYIVLEFLENGYFQDQEEKLGTGLAVLHHYQDSRFGFSIDNYCGSTPQQNDWRDNWIDFFIHNRLRFLLGLIDNTRRFDLDERKIFDRLILKLPGLLPAYSKPSLIHGDLWSGNYIYTQQGPALIDPAPYFADREMELSIMTMFGGFSSKTWSAYKEAFPLQSGWDDRVQIYRLYHILNHFYLFGGSYGSQALSIARKFSG